MMPSTTMSCTQDPSVPRTRSCAISEMYSCDGGRRKTLHMWSKKKPRRHHHRRDARYRDDERRDPAGEAGEHPAQVEHPHVLRRDDDGEAEDEGQRAEHQAQLPADLLHHPTSEEAAGRRPHRHYGLRTQREY